MMSPLSPPHSLAPSHVHSLLSILPCTFFSFSLFYLSYLCYSLLCRFLNSEEELILQIVKLSLVLRTENQHVGDYYK